MKNENIPFDIQGFAPLMQVFDMPLSLKFYRDILGFEVVQKSGPGDDVGWVMLRWKDIEVMLNTAYEKFERPMAPDAARIAAHEDTILYFGCPDVDILYTYLHGKGIDVSKPSITKYGWKALDLKDPDGYALCFHWPLPNT